MTILESCLLAIIVGNIACKFLNMITKHVMPWLEKPQPTDEQIDKALLELEETHFNKQDMINADEIQPWQNNDPELSAIMVVSGGRCLVAHTVITLFPDSEGRFDQVHLHRCKDIGEAICFCVNNLKLPLDYGISNQK